MRTLIIFMSVLLLTGCSSNSEVMTKILFLHHSTGQSVWVGKTNRYLYRLTGKGDVQKFFDSYNRKNGTAYVISEMIFPKSSPYGWSNYPYDYYNIWVKNAGENPFMEEPTLEILTKEYEVIIFKHCYPVSNIQPDNGNRDIDSNTKTLANYMLQYESLKSKMHEFPNNKFIIWTPAVNTQKLMTEEEAIRTRQFHKWIIDEWDEKGDNIFIWDFYKYETDGGLYLTDANAFSPDNSHPGRDFAGRIAPLFGKFIADVISGYVE